MNAPDKFCLPAEVYLQPGELFFAAAGRARTLLGSCVALTCWHPGLGLGGMCHYLLPTRSTAIGNYDGRYADEAVLWLLAQMQQIDTRPAEYQIKMFGGGNMFPAVLGRCPGAIGDRNIAAGQALLQRHGLALHSAHVGGDGHRQIVFDVHSGATWVRKARAERCGVGGGR